MSKNIIKAEYAGFCSGVKRAVSAVKRLKNENKNKNICILGELIHNSNVIKELEASGIHTISDINEAPGGICVIRTHGMPPDDIENIKQSGFELFDLTCPDVKKVQQKAVQLAKEGSPVIILGNGGHPEVTAIKAYAEKYSDKVFVIQNTDELDKIIDVIKKEKKAGIAAQTTLRADFLQEAVSKILCAADEVKVFNTICKSTVLRQKAAADLAAKSDLMVVIGGRNSANTAHLAEITSKITPSVLIETAEDLDLNSELIKNAQNIGVTAGASTPENIISDVIKKLETI